MSRTEEEFEYHYKYCREKLYHELEIERAKVAALLTIATRLEELAISLLAPSLWAKGGHGGGGHHGTSSYASNPSYRSFTPSYPNTVYRPFTPS